MSNVKSNMTKETMFIEFRFTRSYEKENKVTNT